VAVGALLFFVMKIDVSFVVDDAVGKEKEHGKCYGLIVVMDRTVGFGQDVVMVKHDNLVEERDDIAVAYLAVLSGDAAVVRNKISH